QEFGTQGDASFFVFRNPRNALVSAVAAQRALAEAEWPERVELRVRMGIHTGEAAIAAGKYLGLAVNRAARIFAIGHVGQILVSPPTHAPLEEAEHEFPGLSFRDLGAQEGQAKVVMLTAFDMDEYVYEALRAGASGFLLKDVPQEQLIDGIRAVASGDALLAPSVTRRVIEEFVRRPPESVRTPPPALA